MKDDLSSDPIDYDNEKGKWFFWDEVWAYPIGYWNTEEEARKRLKEYVSYLDIECGSLPDLPHEDHDIDD